MSHNVDNYRDVFISFSFADQDIADTIVNQLYYNHNISYWICTHDIYAGLHYDDEITSAIKNSKVVVLIQSHNSVQSKEVPKEIRLAVNVFHKPVIPFILDDSHWDNGIAYHLTNVHYIDATKPPLEKRIADLADSIYAITKPRKESLENAKPSGFPHTFGISNLSVLAEGRFLYLGSRLSSFSLESQKYCIYDKFERKFHIAHLSPLQLINEFTIDINIIQNCDVMFSNDSHYFAILTGNRLRIFDMTENRWITSPKGNIIHFYKSQIPLFIVWLNNTIVFLCGQGNIHNCKITSLTMVSISSIGNKPQHFDISNLKICGVLKGCYSHKQGYVIAYNQQHQLLVINLTTVSVVQNINSEYLNQLMSAEIYKRDGGINQISPDGKMYCILPPNGGLKIYSTDEEILIDDIYFESSTTLLSNGRLLILDKSSGIVSLNDYTSSTKKTIFNSDFFLDNELFYHSIPFCLEYDMNSNTYIFFVKNSEATLSRIVCVNESGSPVGVSDEISIAPGNQEYIANMQNGVLLLGNYILKGEKGYKDNCVNTYIYGARYSYTANNELEFKCL